MIAADIGSSNALAGTNTASCLRAEACTEGRPEKRFVALRVRFAAPHGRSGRPQHRIQRVLRLDSHSTPVRLRGSRAPRLFGFFPFAACLWMSCGGCRTPANSRNLVASGQYGKARAAVAASIQADKAQRSYMYDRIQLALVNLADGLPAAATPAVNEAFDILRTQGINKDRTVNTLALWEGVNFWKGEPFEQAMTFVYTAIHRAMLDDWDNARAAASNALFLLQDFGETESGKRRDTRDIAIAASEAERANDEPEYDFLDQEFRTAKSNFCLGYLLAGLANAVLARDDADLDADAEEALKSAWEVNPAVSDVVHRIRNGDFNTVFVVDYGFGPRKERYGEDGVFTRFRPSNGWTSDAAPLRVRVNGGTALSLAAATDLNEMAADHMWRDMAQVRVAKSRLGMGAQVVGGALQFSNDNSLRNWGMGIAAIGSLARLTAGADITYCDILPQRVYVVPITITAPRGTVEMMVEGDPSSRMVLCGLGPPPDGVQLRYVRMTPLRARFDAGAVLPWAHSGTVYYANDAYSGRVEGDTLPYILGGHCVRSPTDETLRRYQEAGNLTDMSLEDLKDLYRDEGIVLGEAAIPRDTGAVSSRLLLHVLEGGRSLACPLAGTAGFARLFCQEHAPYQPTGNLVRDAAARYATH